MKARPTAHSDLSARQRLLSAAADLFNRKGFASTTVREIVEAAAVTKPVLYYYFGNKEGIYLELMSGPLEEFERLLSQAAEERGTVQEKILRLCDRTFALFEENIPLVRLMNSIYYGPPQGAPFIDMDALHMKLQDLLRKLIAKGMRAGEIRRGRQEDFVWAVIGALNIAMQVDLCHPEMAIGRKGLTRILKAIFEGLGTQVNEPESQGGREPGRHKKS